MTICTEDECQKMKKLLDGTRGKLKTFDGPNRFHFTLLDSIDNDGTAAHSWWAAVMLQYYLGLFRVEHGGHFRIIFGVI